MKFHRPPDWSIEKVPDKAKREFYFNDPLPEKYLPATYHLLGSASIFDSKCVVPEGCTHVEVNRTLDYCDDSILFYRKLDKRLNPNFDEEMLQWTVSNKYALDQAKDVYDEWSEWRQEELYKIEQEKEDAERKMLIELLHKYGQPE